MSFFAHLTKIAADATMAGVEASPFAYSQGGNGNKKTCTPCAIAARREGAATRVHAITGRIPVGAVAIAPRMKKSG